MNAPQTPFADWVTVNEWVATDGSPIFTSKSSWGWFWRQHRQRLHELGAVQHMGARLMANRRRLPVAVVALEHARTKLRLAERAIGELSPDYVTRTYLEAVEAARAEIARGAGE